MTLLWIALGVAVCALVFLTFRGRQPAVARALAVVAAVALTVPAFAGTARMEMIDAGSGAKKELRLKPKSGTKQRMVLTMRMGMEMEMAGMVMPAQQMPPMLMTMETEVTSVAKNGDITYAFNLVDADVQDDPTANPMVVTAMRDEIKKMVGLTGTVVMSNQGVTRSADFKVPDSADPEMKANMEKSMEQMGAQLPEQAVGVGAQWKVVEDIDEQGMKITNTTTYELKSFQGNKAVIGIKIVQNADPQDIDAPGMPPGATARLMNLDSNGTGETTLDLAQILPTTSHVSMKMATKMNVSAEGASTEMSMKIDMDMSMQTK